MRLLVSAADFGTCCLEDLEANTFKILLLSTWNIYHVGERESVKLQVNLSFVL